ncbi:MAG: phosphate ABC transporter permease PstA [Alphaproteobacteria bacterium]|nr:phosphate ABC transporter permease PstA [Alphaproteobacteria bacterium]MBT4083951.1 phosphate ABC transporter permease PstA [Alphaproteobacteria bacterium]MBT4542518.1 phosphate ABC transporter permease PstA [Alphaproteobacteria bacterium]MBT6385095.1 phosphate ABC transporter permease PstA [Alphaproteobacteria bacterium]MBT7744139.1 phosphate ABC transporter permease PstA [Alphaproteobacteria bacterium]
MTDRLSTKLAARLRKRHRGEKLFRLGGLGAILLAVSFLATLLVSIGVSGYTAFQQTTILLQINLPVDPVNAGYPGLVKKSLREAFPSVSSRRNKKELYRLVSSGAAWEIRNYLTDHPDQAGKTVTVTVTASDDVDMLINGKVSRLDPPQVRRLSDQQVAWIDQIRASGNLKIGFNTNFFFNGDSREPELAGIAAAMAGSFFSLIICLGLAFPLGIMAAIYLEEFASKTRLTSLIEVNINNLAAVPSIVFGLLGLAIFLNFFELPRSAPLVGGMVLALMTLPTIIITGRASLKAVPPSIREAALAIGASKVQSVFHHVLPLALPGVLTGTIIGMARAVGETAPLLMIGMVAFIVDVPKSILEPATALPVQVFLWADAPERAFEERTAATIIVLLVFLMAMNLIAVILRRKFEVRW